jgi:ATP-dependent Lon protease
MIAEATDAPTTKPRLDIPTGALVIVPMRNRVLYPSMVMPLMVGSPARLQAVEEAVRQQVPIGFIVQRDPNTDSPQPKDLYEVGTAADVLRMFTLPDGRRQVIVQGRRRFEIGEVIQT